MSILDSELADTLTEALNAFDIPQACIITRQEVSGPPWDPTLTPVDYAAMGWRDTYSAAEHLDSTVLVQDVKAYIIASSTVIVPTVTDKITITGKTYTVVNVSADPARACWVCQCRA
ncbi:hypothetical protein [Bradyrhizobium sp. LA6.7]|uniref:hypothetical protein n=1 Tax=unclassified Bradyrhizobium TaxID=2631580 RepID=UPI0033995581